MLLRHSHVSKGFDENMMHFLRCWFFTVELHVEQVQELDANIALRSLSFILDLQYKNTDRVTYA